MFQNTRSRREAGDLYHSMTIIHTNQRDCLYYNKTDNSQQLVMSFSGIFIIPFRNAASFSACFLSGWLVLVLKWMPVFGSISSWMRYSTMSLPCLSLPIIRPTPTDLYCWSLIPWEGWITLTDYFYKPWTFVQVTSEVEDDTVSRCSFCEGVKAGIIMADLPYVESKLGEIFDFIF